MKPMADSRLFCHSRA